METLLFCIFGAIAFAAAINVVAQRRVFYSVLSLIICLSAIAGLYMLLEAPFVAAIQIIVYAGAIMVMFLFVIMLLDPFSSSALQDKKKSLGFIGILLGTITLVLLCSLLKSYNPAQVARNPEAVRGGVTALQILGSSLFRDYLLPFEVTSVLVLVAIIGAVVLAQRRS
jgi:NADH-quinone oxidoreductase subunit J